MTVANPDGPRDGDVVAVLDCGKTNLKLVAVGEDGRVTETSTTPNAPVDGPPYPHADVERMWRWMLDALAALGRRRRIAAIVPTGYGSTAACVDRAGLVLPVMDYEAVPPLDVEQAYAALAPPFDEVYCTVGPAALTLGRQLFWQASYWPNAAIKAFHILTLPQYWSWRLTGVAASEVTSLGAQTQLWASCRRDFSSLVDRLGLRGSFPPIRPAREALATITRAVATATGLAPTTPVLNGIHDSNANYFRYLAGGLEDFSLLSTGTWIVGFNPTQPLERLRPGFEMASNTDVFGRPVASIKYMGGREYVLLAGETPEPADLDDVAALIRRGTRARPSFTNFAGPFPGTAGAGRIDGPPPANARERMALASLYTALASTVCLDLLDSASDIVIDGPFARSPLFCQVLAALRPAQRVLVSPERDGTALGAALLWHWPDGAVPLALEPVEPPTIPDLAGYAAEWRAWTEG